ncbi:3-deoxy-D-manno-octulosonic acid transferase [Neptunomonas qingdaonensis]|uniref:3-deoxy-D-manno-octulosonic acid transferase n=1 Tax=Neptunomonas qingdaonensis TaxID=1045558 RepID=A0A1I2MU00_9GAMM|nr:glycosyltransferase N-terminal domain-containing protein [Neptunomonas qingdaonensis]SFF95055.1 3-deoxy-D-manno-octulosonic-acid transferase [Neptunomonas qingdaonensis]
MKILRVVLEHFFWYVYIFMVKANNLIRGVGKDEILINNQNGNVIDGCVWVFCSTIGEFNACKLFLTKFIDSRDVLFITDRGCYSEAFKREFPNAYVVNISGNLEEVDYLIKKYIPTLFIACEIPCSPNDAPCRLSYALIRKLKEKGIKLYLVNGWLYEYAASCMQDKVERFLFQKYYINSFEIITVQTDKIKQLLIEKGGDSNKIHVTGNMKFDAVINNDFNIDSYVLDYFSKNLERIVTAGCVTEEWEYEIVLDAYTKVLVSNPNTKLIIAPRHPEKSDQLELLVNKIIDLQLTFMYRSMWNDLCPFDTQILIINTFGELKSFYAYADVCYVGVNHNVLEPLSFNKPVIVLDNWNKQYPSFPVFDVLSIERMINVCHSAQEISNTIIKSFNNELIVNQLNISNFSGALNKNLELIK